MANTSPGDGTHDRDRKYEVDRTPPAVVLQGLNALAGRYCRDFAHVDTLRALDPCAGSGVFAQQLRRSSWAKFASVRSIWVEGVDIREEEREWMERHCDAVTCGDAISALDSSDQRYHLVVGNPAFSLFGRKGSPAIVDAIMPKMATGGVIMLLATNELGSRGSATRELFARHPPVRQMRIGGTIKFRVGANPRTGKAYGCDARSYSWWVWQSLEYRSDSSWIAEDLECLSASARQWKVIPGREACSG